MNKEEAYMLIRTYCFSLSKVKMLTAASVHWNPVFLGNKRMCQKFIYTHFYTYICMSDLIYYTTEVNELISKFKAMLDGDCAISF